MPRRINQNTPPGRSNNVDWYARFMGMLSLFIALFALYMQVETFNASRPNIQIQTPGYPRSCFAPNPNYDKEKGINHAIVFVKIINRSSSAASVYDFMLYQPKSKSRYSKSATRNYVLNNYKLPINKKRYYPFEFPESQILPAVITLQPYESKEGFIAFDYFNPPQSEIYSKDYLQTKNVEHSDVIIELHTTGGVVSSPMISLPKTTQILPK